MNKELQRIKIAEACGWTEIELCTCHDGINRGYEPTIGAHKKHLPDYLNDLNAIHTAEKILTDQQWVIYSAELWKITNNPLHATAAQLAEAFLKTLGLWEES